MSGLPDLGYFNRDDRIVRYVHCVGIARTDRNVVVTAFVQNEIFDRNGLFVRSVQNLRNVHFVRYCHDSGDCYRLSGFEHYVQIGLIALFVLNVPNVHFVLLRPILDKWTGHTPLY